MATIRILLKSNVTRGEVEYMALDYEWQLYTKQEQVESGGTYKVWLDGEGDDQSVIIYTEDALAELRYITVEGNDVEPVAAKIRASVDVETRAELEKEIALANQHHDWISVLRKLGATLSKTYEQWGFDALSKGLAHPDPRVRLAALAAIGFPAWPEFIEPLRKVQETDDDQRVLRRAARLLGLLQSTNKAAGENGTGAT